MHRVLMGNNTKMKKEEPALNYKILLEQQTHSQQTCPKFTSTFDVPISLIEDISYWTFMWFGSLWHIDIRP